MRKGINPLGRSALAAALAAALIGATATAFAQDYGRGDYNHDQYRGQQVEHHEHRPVHAYQPRYYAPPPVVYTAPPPQYAPPVDLFFSIGIH
ncbi:MAG: hypothetical protein ACREEL_01395 [Stellaceae bacterium]